MTTSDPALLRRLESELARRGLLLLHDRALASVTTLVVGAPVPGSWWGHSRGKEIYRLLLQLEQGAGALAVKLINGKLTFIDRRLWPALLAVVQSRELLERCALSAGAHALYAELARRNEVTVQQLRSEGFAPPTKLMSALRELERHLLLHTESEHTTSGAHHKRLRSWAHWAQLHATAPLANARAAFDELTAATQVLSHGTAAARLPWPAPAGQP